MRDLRKWESDSVLTERKKYHEEDFIANGMLRPCMQFERMHRFQERIIQ